jgi:hypothetical protein
MSNIRGLLLVALLHCACGEVTQPTVNPPSDAGSSDASDAQIRTASGPCYVDVVNGCEISTCYNADGSVDNISKGPALGLDASVCEQLDGGP